MVLGGDAGPDVQGDADLPVLERVGGVAQGVDGSVGDERDVAAVEEVGLLVVGGEDPRLLEDADPVVLGEGLEEDVDVEVGAEHRGVEEAAEEAALVGDREGAGAQYRVVGPLRAVDVEAAQPQAERQGVRQPHLGDDHRDHDLPSGPVVVLHQLPQRFAVGGGGKDRKRVLADHRDDPDLSDQRRFGRLVLPRASVLPGEGHRPRRAGALAAPASGGAPGGAPGVSALTTAESLVGNAHAPAAAVGELNVEQLRQRDGVGVLELDQHGKTDVGRLVEAFDEIVEEVEAELGLAEDDQAVGVGIRLDGVDAADHLLDPRPRAAGAGSATLAALGGPPAASAEHRLEQVAHLERVGVLQRVELGGPRRAGEVPVVLDQLGDLLDDRRLGLHGHRVLLDVDRQPQLDRRSHAAGRGGAAGR